VVTNNFFEEEPCVITPTGMTNIEFNSFVILASEWAVVRTKCGVST
jgi:hypothetical protein